MPPPVWKGKKIELIQEASKLAILKLQAQVQIATSADQRATVLAGIYVAAATGVIVAIVTAETTATGVLTVWGGTASAVMFLVGAIFCIIATLPITFDLPGNEPNSWYEDIENNRSIEETTGEQLVFFDEAIIDNNKRLRDNARYFKIGALAGIAAPLIGVAVAGFVCLVMHVAR